jgi:hypothetical protein
MKTNFMKKAVMLTAVVATLILSSAFIQKDTKSKANYGDSEEYIYLIAYSGTQNNSKNSYISGIIHYQGYDACSKNYITKHDFFAKAGGKFMKDVEEYNNLNINEWKIQYNGETKVSHPSGYFSGYGSKSEAQKDKDNYIDNTRDDAKVFETYFTFSCE